MTDIEEISKSIRSHWSIENKVHWCLDVVYVEDAGCKRTGFSAENFSTIHKIVLNIMWKDKDNKRFKNQIGANSKRLYAYMDNEYLMELLNLQ